MHRTLQIPEVLLNIFCHFASSSVNDDKSVKRDLAALARTCRAFKEPALDILWSELGDATPLSRCLPEISHYKVTQDHYWPPGPIKLYTFSRPLERAEWDILCSYARRVWWMQDSSAETFDWRFVQRTSMDFMPADPLFQNLRTVICEFTEETVSLLQLPFPSLMRLAVQLPSKIDLRALQAPLRSLAETSPSIKSLEMWSFQSTLKYSKIVSNAIYSWSNLQRLICPEISLDVDNFLHLSRMPALMELSCTLSDEFSARTIPSAPLSFTALNSFHLYDISLGLITRLLSSARLPSLTNFTVIVKSCPLKKDLASFMASMQMAGMGHTVQRFHLGWQEPMALYTIPSREPGVPLLDFDDLRPCMSFHNLLYVDLDLQWDVDLQDEKLLALTSAWPLLEGLVINTKHGWNRPGGITPDGLASLLQMCPSLNRIALVIDTRGYTKSPDRKCREPITSSYEHRFHLDVLDSIIEQESVDAMATFLSGVVPHVDFKLLFWDAWSLMWRSDAKLYQPRWEDVYKKANGALKERWLARTQRSL